MYLPEGFLFDSAQNAKYTADIDGLRTAAKEGAVLEGRAVLCDGAGNLTVDLPAGRFVIDARDAKLPSYTGVSLLVKVGKPVCFKVIDENGRIRLSRAAAQSECESYYYGECPAGRVIDARIINLEGFGAFADIGCGVPALLPVNCMSVSRIAHSRDRFTAGQDIKAVVKDIDLQKRRITLTHRELLGTWLENVEKFEAGQTVAGFVRGVAPYGIFIELAPNLCGLAEPHPDVSAGMCAAVFIKSIIPEKMKIKLAVLSVFYSDKKLSPPEYFITGGDIKSWRYSPPGSSKIIETLF